MDGGKKMRMQAMPNVYTVQVCSVNNTTVQNCLKLGTRCLCELLEKAITCGRCNK
jgi:hypothetical protein